MLRITDVVATKGFSFSFEVTPNLNIKDIDELVEEPSFYSITWHAKTHLCRGLDIPPLVLASTLRSRGKEVLMHLSCDLLKKDYLTQVLTALRSINVCNLLLVRGEQYEASMSDFENCLELIKFIREYSANYFCLGVVGFPGCCDQRLLQLKEKVDSGAEFIITQAFFDPHEFYHFTRACENIGINVPILPGVFLYETYKKLTGFINVCKINLNTSISEHLSNKENCEKGHEITRNILTHMERDLGSVHFHFFTLNKIVDVSKFVKSFRHN